MKLHSVTVYVTKHHFLMGNIKSPTKILLVFLSFEKYSSISFRKEILCSNFKFLETSGSSPPAGT